MRNHVKILAVSAIALSLGACNIATIAPMAGTALGGAGGGLLGNQFGKGQGKTIATIACSLLGGVGGYKAGQFVALPYQNRTAINGNTMNIHRNGQRIDQNGYRIDMNGQRIDDMHSSGRSGSGSNVFLNQGSRGGYGSNYGCRVQNNYVVCNSN